MKKILVLFGAVRRNTAFPCNPLTACCATWTGSVTAPSRWGSPSGGLVSVYRQVGGHPRRNMAGAPLPARRCLPQPAGSRAAGLAARRYGNHTARRGLSRAPRKNGEDGTVQGLLELAGIPVVGCGTLASALCMDKVRAHQLAQAAGVEIPRSLVFDREASEQELMDGAASLGYPLFVKPLRAGSSFGISKVMSADQLQGAWKNALKYDETMILEEAIPGFEVAAPCWGTKP